MDPATQSAQISSSQGFADRQNSAAKESKQSDSFLSSSPVSLIQSPQDKRVILGSDKPCGGVATALHFSSQPGSFTPDNYGGEAGPQDQPPDSQIKISPVSERIKTLEALAAKKREPDFRSGGGFSQFRDRNHEKSPYEIPKSLIEKTASAVQKRGGSADQESPESPFEVLREFKEANELEETEEWMKAHLPPVPDFDVVDLIKGTLTSNISTTEEKETVIDAPAAFSGVPDAFVDSPVEAPKLMDELSDAQKNPSVEEESEFDLSFLPTTYMWPQQETSGVQTPSNLNSVLPASPAPLAGFDSTSVSDDKPTGTGDQEASEVGSSGESDDTVIEDGVSAPPTVSDAAISNDCTSTPASAAPSLPTDEKETPLRKSERKLIQVPTINVIESDEPNYSEEEMELMLEAEEDEHYEVVKDQAREASKAPELESEDSKNEPFQRRPLEEEFIEGYSPPSSPVDSDAEFSPKHHKPISLPEAVHQESASLPNQTDSEDLASNFSHAESEKSQTSSNNVSDEPSPFIVTHEEVDFPDNDDEWSDGAQDVLVKPYETDLVVMEPTTYTQSKGEEKSNTPAKEASVDGASLSKSCFIQDDIYDRQSLDSDYDASPPLDDIDVTGLDNAEELFLSDSSQIHVEPLNASSVKKEVPEDGKYLEDLTLMNDDETLSKTVPQPSLRDHPQDPYSSFQSETLRNISEQDVSKKMITDIVKDNMASGNSLPGQKIGPEIQQDTIVDPCAPDTTSSPGSIDPDHSVYEPADSFVEFMQECLKSRQDEEPDDAHEGVPKKEFTKTGLPPAQFPPTMVMDLEQEHLTISALKELGSSQEKEEKKEVLSSLSKAPYEDQVNLNASVKQSSYASVPNSPCSQSNVMFDSTYSRDVEAIDEWVAGAYHLAEHVLTGILTYISVKDLIHWRDPKKSGLVFGLSMLVLLSLAAFSVISVVSYLLLALLCVTITFRIYKSVVQAVQKSSDGHPFKTLIEKDVSIPPETFRKHVDTSLTYINRALKQMSRLFLVEDLVDSLKLAVFMWLLTYVGAVFNGITILILADILLFAVPPIYEKNKTQIDHYIELARTQVNNTMAKLQEKLPGAVKRSKTE